MWYFKLDHLEQISLTVESEYCNFHTRKWAWKCRLQNGGNFVPALTFQVSRDFHYDDVILMSAMASQLASLTLVYLTVYSLADQRKHQSSASLAFVRGIHRWPVNSPHKWPVTRKILPFDDVIVLRDFFCHLEWCWLLIGKIFQLINTIDLPLVPHMYASVNQVSIGSDDVPSPIRPQAIIWTGHRWIPRTNGQ